MKVLIHKCSVPGWTKEFTSVSEALEEVKSHVCKTCQTGEEFNHVGHTLDLTKKPSGWSDWDYIGSLLSTPCGCEYEREVID